ncbi:peroxiredoxin YgaF [Gracilibacillus halophilus YIM-C55.5]|uniref:thioredoxin-dependent peroxiredoxin n=1 Tax=Gracilibacillus halophilus YIM-C55.5 TaxID=1308866 RepID=N4WQ75_9BACI|nr:thioredoxin-dependent thiol peroxidase [Gracilibacillus halophilus]ENH96595.1 peroxiredoxin YgaF [Gracilibacillus halophilus YIM-C55.5]
MSIEVGQEVKDFTLKNNEGQAVSLSDYRGQNVVLYFYPKDDTPGCTTEACDFRDNHESFKELDAVILGVSPDSEESHKSFAEKHDLPFELLVDEDKEVAEQFGVWQLKKKAGKESMGIVRSTFIIDKEGVLQKEFRQVQVNGHVEEALNYIREEM